MEWMTTLVPRRPLAVRLSVLLHKGTPYRGDFASHAATVDKNTAANGALADRRFGFWARVFRDFLQLVSHLGAFRFPSRRVEAVVPNMVLPVTRNVPQHPA